MMPRPLRRLLAATVCVFCLASAATTAADWPQWRHDAGRTATTPESLPGQLYLHWVRQLPPPRPAWPADQKKLQFDACYEPVAAGGLLIVGSMDDDSVTAYRADSGRQAWRFYTEGPVRFAPVVYKDKVWAVSDDGWLYCLDLASGKCVWKLRGGPDGRRVIGNGRLVSMWPARGGPVIQDGTLYFAAGVWPFMGTFIYAIDPDTRQVLWCNSASGSRWTLQQHGSPAFAGVVPQGYIAVSGDTLLVSGGRTVPAAFDAKTGAFRYFDVASREAGKNAGGYDVAAAGGVFFNSGKMHNVSDGSLICLAGADVLTSDAMYATDGSDLVAFSPKVTKVPYTDRGGEKAYRSEPVPLWRHELPVKLSRLFLRAGGRLFGASSSGDVVGVDLSDPSKFAWQAKVIGEPKTMLAANGRLFAVTADGRVWCFAANEVSRPTQYPLPNDPPSAASADGRPGKSLISLAGVNAGYAVVLGADKALVDSLVAQSKLDVIVLDADAAKVADLREHMGKSYGLHVSAIAADLSAANLPPYLASLIIAPACTSPESFPEAYRILRPYGGTMCLPGGEASTTQIKSLIAAGKLPGAEVAVKDGWVLVKRPGPLPGAGAWTHQYADAGNTVVSPDKLVRVPLGILWFGGPSNEGILPRHGHGPSPQVVGGRLFIEGRDMLRAVDVYTGRLLWQTAIKALGRYYDITGHQPGANEIGSNYVSTADCIYVITPDKCVVLDPATGRVVREIRLPADLARSKWGFITVWDKYLIAAVRPAWDGRPGDYAPDSDLLLVMDRHTGRELWRRKASQSFRHNTIVAGGDKVYCIDGIGAKARAAMSRRGEQVPAASVLYALDAATGKVVWRDDKDIFGTWLAYSAERDVLLQAGSAARDRAGDEVGQGLTVYHAANGKAVWKDLKIGYSGPCMIHHDQIITDNGAMIGLMNGTRGTMPDPLTGQPIPWRFTRMYGCNTAIASENLITFRSAAAGYVDLTTSAGTGNLGGFKSGCTSNLIAADGVLNAPDYTRTCSCSYQNQSSLAMIHMPDAEQWTFLDIGKSAPSHYPSRAAYEKDVARQVAIANHPPSGPVARIGVNFGAPGDHAFGGTYWLEYPIVGGPSPAMGVKFIGGRAYCHYSGLFAGGELNFVGASGLAGAKRVTVILDPTPKPGTRKFTVRLMFAEPDVAAKPGDRVFDTSLQGKRVLEGFDIAKSAGGPRRVVVREFAGVAAAGTLTIDLSAVKGETILCGLEVIASQK